jgi:ligand-binding SRPBCC domain-containing protein
VDILHNRNRLKGSFIVTLESVPVNTKQFEKRSVLPHTTVEKVWAFHATPNAFKTLTPPPMFIQVRENKLTSLTNGDVHFTLWLVLIPVKWWARHEPGPIETSFADRMIEGPLAYWRHEHIFRAVSDGVELTDRITLAHKPGLAGLFSRLFFDGVPLQILFLYRHLRTRWALRS